MPIIRSYLRSTTNVYSIITATLTKLCHYLKLSACVSAAGGGHFGVGVLCGKRNAEFRRIFAEILMQNVPQIIR